MTEWDGRPQNPERDGWHWLAQDALRYPARWDAAASAWHRSRYLFPDEIARLNDYLGPCLTPDKVEARVAAARREGIEAAMGVANAEANTMMQLFRDETHNRCDYRRSSYLSECAETSFRIAAAIRALLTKGGR